MTANSALNQNWVGCTVRTPKAQVVRTLRAQCPGCGRCCAHSWPAARMSRAQPVHVARLLGVHWSRHAQAASLMSRPHFDVATSRQPESCRDIKSVSRHHPNTSMSRHQIGVATSFLLPSLKPGRHPMSRHQFHVVTSRMTNLCRDIKFMSRHQFSTGQIAMSVPCRDLPLCRPCRDINFMSRHRFCCPRHCPCRDLAMMSRHQACLTPFQLRRDAMSRPPLLPPMSRPHFDVAASIPTGQT